MTQPYSPERAAQAHEFRMQRLALPVMIALLVGGAVFFAGTSLYELRALYARLEPPASRVDVSALASAPADAAPEAVIAARRFAVLAAMEAEAIDRRYRLANSVMLARVWTRQLGFVTGMLLAIVGAAFILGRLNDPPTELKGEGQGISGSLSTSSPGIVLAVLGSGLMAMTLAIPFKVETFDRNVYLDPAGAAAGPAAGPVALPPPEGRLPTTGETASGLPMDPVKARECELFGCPEVPK